VFSGGNQHITWTGVLMTVISKYTSPGTASKTSHKTELTVWEHRKHTRRISISSLASKVMKQCIMFTNSISCDMTMSSLYNNTTVQVFMNNSRT